MGGFCHVFPLTGVFAFPDFFLKLVPQGSSLNVNFLNASYDTFFPNLNPINFPFSGFLLVPYLALGPDKNVDSINRQ